MVCRTGQLLVLNRFSRSIGWVGRHGFGRVPPARFLTAPVQLHAVLLTNRVQQPVRLDLVGTRVNDEIRTRISSIPPGNRVRPWRELTGVYGP